MDKRCAGKKRPAYRDTDLLTPLKHKGSGTAPASGAKGVAGSPSAPHCGKHRVGQTQEAPSDLPEGDCDIRQADQETRDASALVFFLERFLIQNSRLHVDYLPLCHVTPSHPQLPQGRGR